MPCPPHSPWFDHPKTIIAKSTNHEVPHYVVFSTSCYLVPLRPKYFLKILCSTYLQPTFLSQYKRPSFTPILTYLLTYLLTPWSRVLLEKLTVLQLVKKFPAFYGTRKFITAFTSAGHLSLSWASLIQPIPLHPATRRSILILFSHLRLGLSSGLFPSGFPTKILHTSLPSPIRSTCPAHPILLDFTTRTMLGEQYRSLSSSLCSFLHSPVTSSLLGPNNTTTSNRTFTQNHKVLSWAG